MKKSNVLRAAAVAMVAALSIGGALAYFSATTETKNNTFTIVAGEKEDEVENAIVETVWDSELDQHDELQPGETVNKDPKVQNVTDYDAYVFLEVSVPTISAKMDGDVAEKYYEIVDLGDINAEWDLIHSEPSSTADPGKYIIAYKTVLEDGATTTSAAFDDFTVKDFTYVSAADAAKSFSIDVSGKMIQSVGYADYEEAATALGYTVD